MLIRLDQNKSSGFRRQIKACANLYHPCIQILLCKAVHEMRNMSESAVFKKQMTQYFLSISEIYCLMRPKERSCEWHGSVILGVGHVMHAYMIEVCLDCMSGLHTL